MIFFFFLAGTSAPGLLFHLRGTHSCFLNHRQSEAQFSADCVRQTSALMRVWDAT